MDSFKEKLTKLLEVFSSFPLPFAIPGVILAVLLVFVGAIIGIFGGGFIYLGAFFMVLGVLLAILRKYLGR